MQLRSGNLTKYQPRRTKGFHVKARAANPLNTNILISENEEKLELGKKYQVMTERRKVTLIDFHRIAEELKKKYGKTYLLIAYGTNWLYLGVGPLDLKGPRPVTAAGKVVPELAVSDDVDRLEVSVTFTEPVKSFDRINLGGVMGCSAKDYATREYGAEWASDRDWEWLHIIAHSLGGADHQDNLVAGTYNANTEMIPYESTIRNLTQIASNARPVIANWTVDVYPGTRIAIAIRMQWSAIHNQGFTFASHDIRAQRDYIYDKLEYDLRLLGN